MKAALEGQYSGPGYSQDGWVELGGYAESPWDALIDLWKMSNEALAGLTSRIPREAALGALPARRQPVRYARIPDRRLHPAHAASSRPYLSREEITAYPGAAIGV